MSLADARDDALRKLRTIGSRCWAMLKHRVTPSDGIAYVLNELAVKKYQSAEPS